MEGERGDKRWTEKRTDWSEGLCIPQLLDEQLNVHYLFSVF